MVWIANVISGLSFEIILEPVECEGLTPGFAQLLCRPSGKLLSGCTVLTLTWLHRVVCSLLKSSFLQSEVPRAFFYRSICR